MGPVFPVGPVLPVLPVGPVIDEDNGKLGNCDFGIGIVVWPKYLFTFLVIRNSVTLPLKLFKGITVSLGFSISDELQPINKLVLIGKVSGNATDGITIVPDCVTVVLLASLQYKVKVLLYDVIAQ